MVVLKPIKRNVPVLKVGRGQVGGSYTAFGRTLYPLLQRYSGDAKTILEIGAGKEAAAAKRLAEQHPQKRIIAVDLEAKPFIGGPKLNLHVKNANIANMKKQIGKGSVDLVYEQAVLPSLVLERKHKKTLAEVNRVLRTHGKVIFSTVPNETIENKRRRINYENLFGKYGFRVIEKGKGSRPETNYYVLEKAKKPSLWARLFG